MVRATKKPLASGFLKHILKSTAKHASHQVSTKAT